MMRITKVVLAALLVALLAAAPASASQAPNFQSDEFNICAPLTVWTTSILPNQGVKSSADGTQLELTVPKGESQTISQDANDQLVYNVARVVQQFGGAGNEDFGVEVKFDSNVKQQFQQQGIVLESGPENLLRFEFHYGSGKTNIYAAHIYVQTNPTTGLKQTVRRDYIWDKTDLSAATSLYLKVSRTGGAWEMEYKTDSTGWTTANPITDPNSDPAGQPIPRVIPGGFLVTGVGVYAGTSRPNTTTEAPGHTAVVDYFFNAITPITDGDNTAAKLTLDKQGEGTVVVTPAKPDGAYTCGDEVTIQANPADTWTFASWQGAPNASVNPQTFKLGAGVRTITAIFSQSPLPEIKYNILLPFMSR